MVKINLPKLVASIVLCLGVGAIGSIFTAPAIGTWYSTLHKPSFSPPNFLFAPVWTALYILMGVSLYLLWTSKKKGKEKAIRLFLIQLALNFFWSLIFFGMHSPKVAFIEIIFLWVYIFLTIRASLTVSKIAAYLLYPYLFWVSFATLLNLFIALLN
ncbi:MAG: tryptophan-rich sensory protein [Candidatus Levybacteria bacterium]|nr:tryptophan-rich sensory protein [Candidatus Levybacteria bacterium]